MVAFSAFDTCSGINSVRVSDADRTIFKEKAGTGLRFFGSRWMHKEGDTIEQCQCTTQRACGAAEGSFGYH